jgi:hypothetical protein
MTSPVIVVGMPRSGSTLLTRILNESSELFMVNDFYFLQYVDSINRLDTKNLETGKILAKDIVQRIQARIERKDSPELECGLYFSAEDEQKLKKFIRNQLNLEKSTWYDLLEQIMSFSASLLGKTSWGYNTPQDYLHISRLKRHFPDAKFIYMMRDPRAVLCSYKYVKSNGYHETNRYHPILQGLAWRTAIRSFLQQKSQGNCLLIRYEDLIANTNTELSRLSRFLGCNFSQLNINRFGNNSSFKNKNKKLSLSDTEIWLCEQITGKEMQAVGYTLSRVKPRFKDAAFMAYLTARASIFYLSKIILSADVRKRVTKLLKKTRG